MTIEKINEIFNSYFNSVKKSVIDKIKNINIENDDFYHAPLNNDIFIKGTIFNTVNIRYGYFLEDVINYFLEENGIEILSNGKNKNYDLLFNKDNVIYVGEIKMRDNHDSTKKIGQLDNLKKKAIEQKKYNKNKKVIAIFCFIDPNKDKNKNYYIENLNKYVKNNLFDEAKIFYGDEIFVEFNLKNEWEETKNKIKKFNKKIKETNYIEEEIFKN